MSTRRQNDSFTYTTISRLGDELQVRADHGAVYLEMRRPGSRLPVTLRLGEEQARTFFARGTEIAGVASSTGRGA